MMQTMRKAFFAGLLIATVLSGSPALAAGKFSVIELSYVSRFGKELVLHFAAPGGFNQKACKASLPAAIAEFSPNLSKAFSKNYGVDMNRWSRMTFVKGSCQTFDSPPPQLLKLKLSGQ